jgi:hypothetical protein
MYLTAVLGLDVLSKKSVLAVMSHDDSEDTFCL